MSIEHNFIKMIFAWLLFIYNDNKINQFQFIQLIPLIPLQRKCVN